jgi:hypothetical protein
LSCERGRNWPAACRSAASSSNIDAVREGEEGEEDTQLLTQGHCGAAGGKASMPA